MGQSPPYETAFPSLNMPNVEPEGFPIWKTIMDKWGQSMKDAVEGVAEMTALGLGLDRHLFTEAGTYGPHLLAPTASDLKKYGQKDTILAGFHSDLNFLTIQGRSRYPGLHVWARNTGKRISVKVPPGRYLLVQAGKQLEHLTGGLIQAGFHEVVVNESTLSAMDKVRAQGGRPLIRISSTFFWHLSSDFVLQPISSLAKAAEETISDAKAGSGNASAGIHNRYETMKVGTQVQNELKHIALMA